MKSTSATTILGGDAEESATQEVALAMPSSSPPSPFRAAWASLGCENASETLCTLSQVFRHWTVEPNKTDLVSALNFLSGDSGSRGRYDLSARRIHMSRTKEDVHTIMRSCSATDEEEEERRCSEQQLEEKTGATHVLELAVSELKMQGLFRGHFCRSLAADRLWTCVQRLLGCCEGSEESFKRACWEEFRGLRGSLFFLDCSRVSVELTAAGESHCSPAPTSHTPQLLRLRLPLCLDSLQRRGFGAVAKALQWVHSFQLEVLDAPRDALGHNSTIPRHALSLAWDGPGSSVVLRVVKAGSTFLWHDVSGRVQTAETSKPPPPPNTFSFESDHPLVLRVSVGLSLFWGVSAPVTTLYLSATRRDGLRCSSMAVKLIKVAGFSGWVTSLFVHDICETVEILLTFLEEHEEEEERGSSGVAQDAPSTRDHETTSAGNGGGGGDVHTCGDDGIEDGDRSTGSERESIIQKTSPVFSTFSWRLRGSAPANSVLLWLVHILWHKLVMSAFLYEALQLWAGLLLALGLHLKEGPEQEMDGTCSSSSSSSSTRASSVT